MKGPIMATLLTLGAAVASAETPLDSAQLDGLLTGNTVYYTLSPGGPGGPNGGEAPMFYGPDGYVAADLPNGVKLVGTWQLDGAGYCVDWENGPRGSCTVVHKRDGAILTLDRTSGESRGDVARIVPGNPEAL